MVNLKTLSSEILWNLLFIKSPIAAAFISRGLKFQQINEKFATSLSYSSFEFTELSCNDTLHPQDLNIFTEMLDSVAAGKIESFQVVCRLISKLGEVKFHRLDVFSVVQGDELVSFLILATPVQITVTDPKLDSKRSFSFTNFFEKNWVTILPWVMAVISFLFTFYLNSHDKTQDLIRDVQVLKDLIEKMPK